MRLVQYSDARHVSYSYASCRVAEYAEEQKAEAEAKLEQKQAQPAADAEGSAPLESREPTFDSLAFAVPTRQEPNARAGLLMSFHFI